MHIMRSLRLFSFAAALCMLQPAPLLWSVSTEDSLPERLLDAAIETDIIQAIPQLDTPAQAPAPAAERSHYYFEYFDAGMFLVPLYFWSADNVRGDPHYPGVPDWRWNVVLVQEHTHVLRAEVAKNQSFRSLYAATFLVCDGQPILLTYSKSALADFYLYVVNQEQSAEPEKVFSDIENVIRSHYRVQVTLPAGSQRLILRFKGFQEQWLDLHELGLPATAVDSDQDGLADGFEHISYGDLSRYTAASLADVDTDSDHLLDLQEMRLKSNVNAKDTDGDGLPDAWEYKHGLPIIDSNDGLDTDDDGVSDYEEWLQASNPMQADAAKPLSLDFAQNNFQGFHFWPAGNARGDKLPVSELFQLSDAMPVSGWRILQLDSGITVLGADSRDQSEQSSFTATYVVPKGNRLQVTYSKSKRAAFRIYSLYSPPTLWGQQFPHFTQIYSDDAQVARSKNIALVMMPQGAQRLVFELDRGSGELSDDARRDDSLSGNESDAGRLPSADYEYVGLHQLLIPGLADTDGDGTADGYEHIEQGTLDQESAAVLVEHDFSAGSDFGVLQAAKNALEEAPNYLMFDLDLEAFQGFRFWPAQDVLGLPIFALKTDVDWRMVQSEATKNKKILRVQGKGNWAQSFYAATDFTLSEDQELAIVYSKSKFARISFILAMPNKKPKRIYWDFSNKIRDQYRAETKLPSGSGRLILEFRGRRGQFVEVHQFTTPGSIDSDQDGLQDSFEYATYGGLEKHSSTSLVGVDTDGDGLSDLEEMKLGSDATRVDTDGDRIPDGWEHKRKLSPLKSNANKDTDEDGVDDYEEWLRDSDPKKPDEMAEPLTIDFKEGNLRGHYFWGTMGPKDYVAGRMISNWYPKKLNAKNWVLRVTGRKDQKAGSLQYNPDAERINRHHPVTKYMVTYIVPKDLNLSVTYSKSKLAHFTLRSLSDAGEITELYFDRTVARRQKHSIEVKLPKGRQRLVFGFKGTDSQHVDLHSLLMPGEPDSDQDTVADAWEYRYFNTLEREFLGDTEHGHTDTDGDGVTDYLEYQKGRDPMVATQ